MAIVRLTDKDIDALNRVVATEVDHRLAWTHPEEYLQQVHGVVDTILNRVASGRWGGTVADVANARKQFSAINGPRGRGYKVYGSVDRVPDSAVPEPMKAIVSSWLTARATGGASSVGGGLNYANPHFSDASNLNWINALDGPRLGYGNSTHYHGTVAGLTPIEAQVAIAPEGAPLPEKMPPTVLAQRNAVAADYSYLPMAKAGAGAVGTAPVGIAGGQTFVSEDHPSSNRPVGITGAVRPEGPAAGMPRSTSGRISIGNPMAEPPQGPAPFVSEDHPKSNRPASPGNDAVIRYNPGNGVRETVLPGRPSSLPVLQKNISGSPDDRGSAPAPAAPKYVVTKIPTTMKEVNPAYEAWEAKYGLSATPPPPQFVETTKIKTKVTLNPEFGKPVVKEVQAPGLTGARPTLIKTKSPGLGAQAYDQANQASRDRAIAGAADPAKAASRAALAAQWGFE